MLKKSLLRISLALSVLVGCKTVKSAPDVWQCTIAGNPKAFYCINTKTQKRWKLDLDDPEMAGVQCVSGDDYKRLQRWVDYLIGEAINNCK